MKEVACLSLDPVAHCVPGTVLSGRWAQGRQKWLRGSIRPWRIHAGVSPLLPSSIAPVRVPRDLHVPKTSGRCTVLTWLDRFTQMMTLLPESFLHVCSGTPGSGLSVSPHHLLLLLPLLFLSLNLKPLNAGRPQGPLQGPFLILLSASLEISSSLNEEEIHRAWTPSEAGPLWSCSATSPVDSELCVSGCGNANRRIRPPPGRGTLKIVPRLLITWENTYTNHPFLQTGHKFFRTCQSVASGLLIIG